MANDWQQQDDHRKWWPKLAIALEINFKPLFFATAYETQKYWI